MRAPPTAQQPYDSTVPDQKERFRARASGFKEVTITDGLDGQMNVTFENEWSALMILRAITSDPYQVIATHLGVTRAHVKYALFGDECRTQGFPQDINRACRDLVTRYFMTGDRP